MSNPEYFQTKKFSPSLVETQIDEIMIEAVRPKGDLTFSIPSRTKHTYVEDLGCVVLPKGSFTKRTTTKASTSKKALLTGYVLRLVKQLISEGVILTKRELFYRNKDFKSQKVSDGIIEDIACMLECTPQSLNISADPRGCIIGNLIFHHEEEVVDCNYSEKQITSKEMKNIKSDAPFILLVEKHSTLSRLANDNFHKTYGCIIVTGRGEADLATRSFLRKLKMELNIPVVAIMDCDPHGFHTLSCYRYGPKNTAHHNLNLVTPDIRWIGIGPKDVEEHKIPDHVVLDMNDLDINTGKNLLEEIFIKKNAEWVEALEWMVE